VRWSINGRYALSAISIQTDANEDICKIKVWDSLLNQFNDDLTKASNTRLTKNTFVFCTHPFVEELLMTGSDGGLVSLWNINTH
jgi:WD40 repeat protein